MIYIILTFLSIMSRQEKCFWIQNLESKFQHTNDSVEGQKKIIIPLVTVATKAFWNKRLFHIH